MRWSLKEAELDGWDRISVPMTPPSRNPADPPRMTPTIIAPDRAWAALQLSMQNSVVDPIAPPMRAPPSRPMPAPAQKWPLVPAPLERRVTEVVGMTNAGWLDCARMSALWATPRLGARSSGRTMAAKRRGMRTSWATKPTARRGSTHLRVSICTRADRSQDTGVVHAVGVESSGLGNPPRLPSHEVHQNELPQRHRVREVGLPAADRRYLLHEFHETPVPRHLGPGELGERDLLGRVVEQHHAQRVARELRADQVREGQRHLLCRREAVLAVQDHGVRAVEHQHRGRRRAVLGLVHHEVVVLEVDRHAQALALQRVRERGVHVEVERVTVLVGLADRLGLDAGREVLGLVRPEARLADASQQVFQGAVAEKIDALLGEVELHLLSSFLGHPTRTEQRLLARGHLGRLGHVQVALVDQLLNDLVEQLPQLALEIGVARRVAGRFAAQHLEHFGRELARVHERLEDRLPQGVERAVGFFLAELAPERMRVRASGEAGMEEKVGELIEQGLEVHRIGQLGEGTAVRRVLHLAPYPAYRAAEGFPAMALDPAPPPPPLRLGAVCPRRLRRLLL